ncbi:MULTISPECIES: hypothetical protein, partial [unclassified Streptomyces]|uniref:hypothetical protein n=1 Tax=unclassified Streptomyces TaxID=2593676 RepID=UPI001C40691D
PGSVACRFSSSGGLAIGAGVVIGFTAHRGDGCAAVRAGRSDGPRFPRTEHGAHTGSVAAGTTRPSRPVPVAGAAVAAATTTPGPDKE